MPKRIFTQDDLVALPPDFRFSRFSVVNHFLEPYYLSLAKSYSGYNKTLFVFRPLISAPEIESICPSSFDFPMLKSVSPQMLLDKAQEFYAELTSRFSSILEAYQAALPLPVPPRHQGRPRGTSSSRPQLCPILYACLLPTGSGETYPQYFLARINDLDHSNHGKWALVPGDQVPVPPLNIPADTVIFPTRKDAFLELQERLQGLGHLTKGTP